MIRLAYQNVGPLAVKVVQVMLHELKAAGLVNQRSGHLVILDFTHGFPTSTYWVSRNVKMLVTELQGGFRPNLIDQIEFNDDGQWSEEYQQNAWAKAILSGRTGRSTDAVLTQAPFLVHTGDGSYQGGIFVDGVAFGFSGVPAPYDEAIVTTFASILRAYAQQQLAESRQKGNFIEF